MSLPRRPAFQISPPEQDPRSRPTEAAKSKTSGFLARMKRSDSRAREEVTSPTIQTHLEPGGDARNGSKLSLASSGAYSGEFEPPNAEEIQSPASATSPAPQATNSLPVPPPIGAPPKIPAKNPTRSLKESNASSAFLSVSPAHGPSNATATLPLTSLYLVSGLPKSPQTWTLADQDSTAGVHHTEGGAMLCAVHARNAYPSIGLRFLSRCRWAVLAGGGAREQCHPWGWQEEAEGQG